MKQKPMLIAQKPCQRTKKLSCQLIAFLSFGFFAVGVSAAPCFDAGDHPQVCETKEILYQSDDAILVQQKAAQLGSPVKIYEFLRNNAEYALYHGARSNSLNSFLSLRGNDVDLASTLMALFRSQNIKSRYVKGNIGIAKSELSNWLGVINNDLAVSLLADQGIQNIDASDPDRVSFEHVWVEALIHYSDYRGNGPNHESAACVSEDDNCRWIPLSPSYKQKRYKEIYRLLLQDLNFDYQAYYNAENPTSAAYVEGLKNKSPLEIFEEQALAYLRLNHPGVTLEDVIDAGEIIRDESGILPASLPFEVIGPVTRYNSVEDHDAGSGLAWTKYLRTRMQAPDCGVDYSTVLPRVSIPLVDLSTKRLTVTLFDNGGSITFGHRLDGERIGSSIIAGTINLGCNGFTYSLQAGSLIDVILEVDIEPGIDPVEVTYNNLVVGGYYLVATGGESSNASQIQRAYRDLLSANDQHVVLVDDSGTFGPAGTPYVDDGDGALDSDDIPLANNLEAQDDLTGGLLYVAQALYYTRLREESERYGRLKGIVSPISAYLGIVSTDDQVEYLDNVPFAVTPGGLLIDLKGIRLNGSWEIDQAENYSNEAFRFLGHIGSSLEHEVWQEITGYDAISTLRGIQFATGQDKPLLELQNNGGTNNFPAALTDLGFSTSAPSGFTLNNYPDLLGRDLTAWRYSGPDPTTAAFEVFKRDLSGLSNTDNASSLVTYNASNGVDGFFANFDNIENQLQTLQASEGQLKSNINRISTDNFFQTYDLLSANVTSPDGFAVASFSRSASNAYQFSLDETAQHADGTYDVAVQLEAADNNDNNTFSVTGLTGFTVVAVNIGSPSGFAVNSFTQINGDRWDISYRQTSNHANGNYTIAFNLTLVRGSSIFNASVNANTRIVSNRFVDQIVTLTFSGIDVSDNVTVTCGGGPNGESISYTGPPSVVLIDWENCFNNTIAVNNISNLVDFFDAAQGFNPDDHAFRSTRFDIDQYDTPFIRQLQADLYFSSGGYFEYLLPARRPQDSFYLFSVFLKNTYGSDDNLARSTYAIVNNSNLLFGGGYVTAEETIIPALSDDFTNSVFTDTSTVSVTNNDIVRTPSTSDPVSTVSGNMYHDETDLVIKGRGDLNYVFTRTYNSNQLNSDSPLGFGWSHSYAMSLKSNDYGLNPNFDSSQAPENGNNISSSITYTDERGGAHNYVLNDDAASTREVAINPPGEFNSLQLNTPANGQHTLLFRNGVRYVFAETGSDLSSDPAQTARLDYIEDPYNNRLTLSYTGDRLTGISDNLNIAGRSGLTFSYTGNRIDTLTDWADRAWDFDYDAQGNLISMTNPRGDTMRYTYHDGHLLNEVIHPQDRGGAKKQMAFGYYENNQAYNYVTQLGETESLSYDLFRKRTRITNPRGFRSEHYYDANGGLIKLVEKDKGIGLFENNADGLRYRKTDALGFQTQYSFQQDRSISAGASDNFGLVSREIDVLNQSSDISYGVFDQATATIDKRGNATTRLYYSTTDAASDSITGKLQEIRTTLNGTANVLLQSFTYYADTGDPAVGQLKRVVEYIDPGDPSKQRYTDYIYDAGGINVQSQTVSGATSGGSITTTFTYDN